MSFHEVRFPTDISYGSKGGPEFNTNIVETASGYEQRNAYWTYARHKYDVAYGIKLASQLTALIKFFNARRGRAYGFRYKDWADYRTLGGSGVVNGYGIAIDPNDPDEKHYQVYKRYTDTGATYDRILRKIVDNSWIVYIGPNPITITKDNNDPPAGNTINTNTGIITFANHPSGEVTITCEFDVPVRFDVDYLPVILENWNPETDNFVGQLSVPLIEIKC
jgi:uncharacterized protein (TIGR02217 family)